MSEWDPHYVWTTTMSPAWKEANGTDAVVIADMESLTKAQFLVSRIQVVWHYDKLWITDKHGNVVEEHTNE